VQDIKRRFMNNGICIPYNIYAINKEGTQALIKNSFYSLKQALKWNLKKMKHTLKGDIKSKYYAIFRRAFYFAQVTYTWKIISDRNFRISLIRNDWVIKNKTKGIFN
ncbi:MAG: hypothetical protein LH629_13810, partial [Ignavibacteria bacterium]|nr:hypothetical protein [Ignavibacteria bacterium]